MPEVQQLGSIIVTVTSTHLCVDECNWSDNAPTGRRFLIPIPPVDSSPRSFTVKIDNYGDDLQIAIRRGSFSVLTYGIVIDAEGRVAQE